MASKEKETPKTEQMIVENMYIRFVLGWRKWSQDQAQSAKGFSGAFGLDAAEEMTTAIEDKNKTDLSFHSAGLPQRYGGDSALMIARFAEGAITFKLHMGPLDVGFWIDSVEFWVESALLYDRMNAVYKGNRLMVSEQKFARTKGDLKGVIFTSNADKFSNGGFGSFNGFEQITYKELMGKRNKWEMLPAHTIKR